MMAENTDLEMDEMMEVSVPLTDEELEEAVADSTVYVFDDGGAKRKQRQRLISLCAIGTATVLFVMVIILVGEVFHLERAKPSVVVEAPPTEEDVVMGLEEGGGVWDALRTDMLSAIDDQVDPCNDFYQYACGGWIEENKNLDPSQSSYSRSFTKLRDDNQAILKVDEAGLMHSAEIMEDGWPLISPLYNACMDEQRLEELGIIPIQPFLDAIDEQRTPSDFANVLAVLHKNGIPSLFEFGVGSDFHDPDRQIGELDQGGLGLPGRQYYLDEGHEQIVTAYKELMLATMSRVLGLPRDELRDSGRLEQVYELERSIAEISMSIEDRREPENLYHMHAREELSELTPSFDFETYFEQMGFPSTERELNVVNEEFYRGLQGILDATSSATFTDYMKWQTVKETGTLLDPEMQDIFFAYSSHLTGQQVRKDRWKECTSSVNSLLGQLVGRYFVINHFSGSSKEIALDILTTIQDAFRTHLPDVDWMDDETRAAALVKLNAMGDKIGYPDVWPNYDKFVVHPGQWALSVISGWNFLVNKNIAKAGQQTDPDEWHMNPQTVNAYYSPTRNEMVFPAGILQPPFFHKDFPPSVNWGGLGMVMGHELTHGFDDKGRKFDEKGRQRQWWSDDAVAAFEERADCVMNLYEGYEVAPDLPPVKGKQTEGENLADFGGLRESYTALQTLKNHETYSIDIAESEKFFKMSAEKLYFLSFAQVWCQVVTDERAAFLINNDVHSPGKARVNLPLSQFEEFSTAYQCRAGTTMNPSGEKCSVW